MDIKKEIEKLVKKLLSDEKMMASFKKDPISTVEKLIGIDLPNDQIEAVVKGIQAKLGLEKLGINDLDDVMNLAGKLFGKK
ncbi:MAG: hypothetical protein IKV90_01445 [Clostridia bacterium]|nr:hypothetical protein [Clostridia bacterium]